MEELNNRNQMEEAQVQEQVLVPEIIERVQEQPQEQAQDPVLIAEEPAQTDKNEENLEEQVKELTEENEMLFEQLHIVQEELEKYYYKLKDVERNGGGSGANGLQISNEYSKHVEKTLEIYHSLRFSEMHNSLQYRIGNAIVKLKGSGILAPFKLWGILSFFSKTKALSSLGGKDFTKVIETYEKDKDDALKKLLDSEKITSIVRANAYTALAKHYQYRDLSVCVKFASMAYKTDPQAYRLKWWLLRLDDKGDYTTACALVGLLPKDTPMKDVEKAKIAPIRRKAEQVLKQKSQTVKVNAASPETQKKLNASIAENKKLKDELAKQKKTSETITNERNKLKDALDTQKKRIETLENEHNANEERFKMQNSLIASYEENLNTTKKRLYKLENKNAKYKKKIAGLTGGLAQVEKTVAIIQEEKNSLLQEVIGGKR